MGENKSNFSVWLDENGATFTACEPDKPLIQQLCEEWEEQTSVVGDLRHRNREKSKRIRFLERKLSRLQEKLKKQVKKLPKNFKKGKKVKRKKK